MVPVRQYRTFWEFISEGIQAIDLVKVVSEESELQKFIRDIENGKVILIAVIPSSDTDATSTDDLTETAPCFIFILKKTTEADMDEEDLFRDREATQIIMNSVKQKMWDMASDFEHQDQNTRLMRRLILKGMHVDPEFNYLGCNGWSLTFGLKTKGMFNDDPGRNLWDDRLLWRDQSHYED